MVNESNVNRYAKDFPTVFEFASGDILSDHIGKKYIDFFCGAGALNYGHNEPTLKQAIHSFLEYNRPVHCLDMDSRIKEDFLNEFYSVILKPRGLDYKVQFVGPTGTNAVEAAIRLSRIVTKRRTIVSFTHSYHGMTATSIAASGSLEGYQKNNPLQNVVFFPYDKFLGSGINTVEYLKQMLITDGSGVEMPAAIILETIQAEGGVNISSIRWLQDLKKFAEDNDILLIVYDIQVGCGRTGTFFSFERAGITPDIVLLSKSISGFGLPLSLVLIKKEFDVWKPGEHSGTFRSNNLALCTGKEALTFWKDGNLEKEVFRKGEIIRKTLADIASRSRCVIDVRGVGMIWGIEFINGLISKKVAINLFEDGLLIETCGSKGQVLKILPALTILDKNLHAGLDKIVNAVIEVEGKHEMKVLNETVVAK